MPLGALLSGWLRLLAAPAAVAVALILVVGLAGVIARSQPGDPAYALRRAAASASVRLLTDSVERAARHLRLAEWRLAEAESVWEKEGDVDLVALADMRAQVDAALAELAAAETPQAAQQLLGQLLGFVVRAQAWASERVADAPAADRTALAALAEHLQAQEDRVRAALEALQNRPSLDPEPAATLVETPAPAQPTATATVRPSPTATLADRTPAQTNDPRPTATRTPTNTPSPTAMADESTTPEPAETQPAGDTPQPTPQDTPDPTETPRPTESPEPTDTPEPPQPTRTPTGTSEPTETPEPPEPTDTPDPTETPEPPEPTETPDPTETPRPTRTPTPTDPPEPTDTPDPIETPEPPEPTETPDPD